VSTHHLPHDGKAGPKPALTRNRRSSSKPRGATSRNTVVEQRLPSSVEVYGTEPVHGWSRPGRPAVRSRLCEPPL